MFLSNSELELAFVTEWRICLASQRSLLFIMGLKITKLDMDSVYNMQQFCWRNFEKL